jgi:membrane protease YdiL (CAAX protease family)
MWSRLPVLVRAPLLGICVASAASLTWSVIVVINFQTAPRAPWSAAVMAVFLWFYWRYIGGRGWPASTKTLRARYLRARHPAPEVWCMSLMAGVPGVAALWAFFWALHNLVHVPSSAPGDLSRYSVATVAAVIVVGSAVAAVAEEAGFRGYMQVPLERAYGPTKTILFVSILFSLAHFTHGWQTMIWFGPFYFAVGIVYGWLANLSGSILPSMVLHFVGDVVLYSIQAWGVAANTAWVSSPGRACVYAVLGSMLVAVSIVAFRALARKTSAIAPIAADAAAADS